MHNASKGRLELLIFRVAHKGTPLRKLFQHHGTPALNNRSKVESGCSRVESSHSRAENSRTASELTMVEQKAVNHYVIYSKLA